MGEHHTPCSLLALEGFAEAKHAENFLQSLSQDPSSSGRGANRAATYWEVDSQKKPCIGNSGLQTGFRRGVLNHPPYKVLKLYMCYVLEYINIHACLYSFWNCVCGDFVLPNLHPMSLSQPLSFCPCSTVVLYCLPFSPKFTQQHSIDLCRNHQQPSQESPAYPTLATLH